MTFKRAVAVAFQKQELVTWVSMRVIHALLLIVHGQTISHRTGGMERFLALNQVCQERKDFCVGEEEFEEAASVEQEGKK